MKSVRPGRVKATRVKTPRIVHHGERRYWGWWLLAMALLLAALWQVYEFGKRQGGYLAARELAERVRIAAQMSAQEKRLASLQAEAARYRRQAEIEAQASRKIQEEMVRQQETIADLKAEVKMLKGLISSGAGSLYARDFVIEPATEPRHYRYRFTLVQVKEDVPLTRGKLLMKVIGRVGKKSRTLDRSEFSPDKQKTVKLEFSNYQDVQGEILLPEKFEPREVRIEFLPRNKELKKLDIRFPWPQAQAAKES